MIEIVVSMANLLTRNGDNNAALTILAPIIQAELGDRELRLRANQLWADLTTELPEQTLSSLRENQLFSSLDALVEHVSTLSEDTGSP